METCTLHKGTIYSVELPDGTLSGDRKLEEDLEVRMNFSGPFWRVYERLDDGQYLFVRPDNDASPE